MAKRGQREGTFYQRPDGLWRARVMLGYRPDGKPNTITVYGKTREEAAVRLAEKVADFARGTLPISSKTTVRDYLAEWLENKRLFGGRDGQGLRPNSYRALESPIRLYVLPVLGDKSVQKVTPQDLKRLYAGIMAKGRSVRMAELTHKALKAAFDAAVKEGLLARNPADMVANPPRTSYRAEDRPRLAREDVPRVLEAAKGTPLFMPVLLAMTAGLRRGEILGLRWSDVDLDRGILHVRKQWVKGEDGTWGLGPVKTRAGVRDIPLPADVTAVLRAHKQGQKVVQLQGFVCGGPDGNPMNPTDLSKGWANLRSRLGLDPDLHLHDLRGSFITWLAERGVDPKQTAVMAGHSDPSVVWRFYQQVTPRLQEEAGRALEGILGTDLTR